ncbi:hypothetical protein [Paractinoplanes durhamensis]|uniref:Uncharacterized protein n=1 Tax=Paractinoplanes durhamensis TaxID=113563 RepID=A0ABQ3YSD3_9ACTN|nr:hypothetical protein [Actinoplanes durhamensis]GIE00483.1 hypothetical protein Adu01nite_18330 [Actinoplanes durhamensis]
MLLALVAVALAWRANGRADEAFDKASTQIAGQPATPPPTQEAPTQEPATEPTVEPTTEPASEETGTPTLDAQTKYTVKYSGKSLKIATSRCGESTNIDLDEPRVGVEAASRDFTVNPACTSSGASITLNGGVDGSLAGSPQVKPVECNELIQLSPLPQGNKAIRTGQVYCINTSRDAARVTANTWKMVVLEVTAIAQDGTVTFKASAWDIPL